jgi:hypothetical protein
MFLRFPKTPEISDDTVSLTERTASAEKQGGKEGLSLAQTEVCGYKTTLPNLQTTYEGTREA